MEGEALNALDRHQPPSESKSEDEVSLADMRKKPIACPASRFERDSPAPARSCFQTL